MSITEAAGERRTAKADAMEFLQAVLTGDPVPATEINRMARERDLTIKAIRSAREALGVKIERNGFGPGSIVLWSLPREHTDAHPPSQEGRPKTKDGHEIIGLADNPCDYCGQRVGPPGPQSGPVYLVCNPFNGRSEPLHEDCAGFAVLQRAKASIRFMFHAMVTRVHSPWTFSSPRSRNWRKPIADLMIPNTGSGICLRKA